MPEPMFKVKKTKLSPEAYKKRCKEVMDRDGWKCRLCPSMQNLTVDHIKKRSQGGGDEFENLRTLCQTCHDREDNTIYSQKIRDFFLEHKKVLLVPQKSLSKSQYRRIEIQSKSESTKEQTAACQKRSKQGSVSASSRRTNKKKGSSDVSS